MLFEKAVKIQVIRQDYRHRDSEKSRDAKHAYSLKATQLRWTAHVVRMSDEQIPKESSLQRITGGDALSRWPEEMLQRHPQSISEGFRHTIRVLGTDCTGAIKMARSHQQRSSSL